MKKITTMLLIGVLILLIVGRQMNYDASVNKEFYQTKEPVTIEEAVSNLEYKVKLPNDIPFEVNKSEAHVFADNKMRTQDLQISYYSTKDRADEIKMMLLEVKNFPNDWDGKVDFHSSMNIKRTEPVIQDNPSWLAFNDKETTLYWLDDKVFYSLSSTKGKAHGEYKSFLTIEQLRDVAKSFE